MKVTSIAAATILAVAAPAANAAPGALRNLANANANDIVAANCNKDDTQNPPASCVSAAGFHAGPANNGKFDFSQFTTWDELFAFDQWDLPTVEELNAVYDDFCGLCALGQIFNLDNQFCFLCTLDLDQDGNEGEGIGDLLGIPEIPAPSSCFSKLSTVQTPHGTVTMKNLQVGDRVLAANGAYEPVYAWGHKHETQEAEFLQFNGELEMTGAHLVFLQGKTNPVRADSIQVGDVLQGAEVQSIQIVKRSGVYTPLTPSGTVVVNGIAASSYIALQSDKTATEYVQLQGGLFQIMSIHDFIHMAMSPFRMFTMGTGASTSYTQEGIPTYAAAGIDLAQFADGQNVLVQAVLMLAFLAVTGTSMLLENTFGPTMAPLAVAAGAGAYAVIKSSGIRVRAQKIKSV